jgi:hypothetical protein
MLRALVWSWVCAYNLRMDTSAITKTEAISALERARARLRTISQKTAEVGERAMGAGVTVASSWGTGYAYGRGWASRTIPGTDIPMVAAAGGLALLLGVSGFGGRASDMLCSVGQGVIGADLAIRGMAAGKSAAERK